MRVCDDCARVQGDSLAAALVPVDTAACRRYTGLELIVKLAIRLQPIDESKQSAPRGARWLPPFGQQSEAELRVSHPGMAHSAVALSLGRSAATLPSSRTIDRRCSFEARAVARTTISRAPSWDEFGARRQTIGSRSLLAVIARERTASSVTTAGRPERASDT
jgi:hypothetical protein